MTSLPLNSGRPLLRSQELLLRSPATVCAIFGGWRSGKTRGCALKFLANCIANPWRPEYGEDHPFSIVIGLTHKVLMDSAHRELKAIIPRAAILRERKGASIEIELINGHVIKFRTAKGAIEGASCCGVWLDEAHLLPSVDTFLNYQMRASDALGARFLVLVSGLPESGWLQDTFDRPEHRLDPSRLVVMSKTSDNIYNPPHVIAQFRSSVSRATAQKYLEGQWMPREGVIYHEWDPRLHVVRDEGDRAQPVHLSSDIGDQGALLFLQERKRKVKDQGGKVSEVMGLHVVDEVLPDNLSTEAAMRLAQARGWIIHPQRSIVFVDPTTRRDEFANVRKVFGDEIRIIKAARGTESERVEYGHDCVNAALRDVDGNVRLTISDGLQRTERSLLTVITKYHRNPKNSAPVRDNVVDHVLDALRYPVAHLLPLKRGGHDVRNAA